MKPQEIQELIDFISKSGLDEVNIETSDFKIAVKKHSANPQASAEFTPRTSSAAPAANPAPAAAPAPQTTEKAPASAPKEDSSKYIEIKSPMIGTFYRSANPESDAFVKVGDTVKSGQTVCIVEAMKLFNEIESEVSGKIVKILVDNASPVEYDQPLFLVDPS
ncbi:acetyl-CoA carboxylase biotin carboxyl carrier protein [Nafulsella turpanensis]|uniref:acetyl-CoA carboxylase biotin carboxyl carrier protein n=1 Tax=Nafulsella turpanensis TaxID=1265690 RepID=UPI00034CF560|nr:acetyl-CoA carboxylase biotin carboxyl carrier protein [Nafulsella turpanensis]